MVLGQCSSVGGGRGLLRDAPWDLWEYFREDLREGAWGTESLIHVAEMLPPRVLREDLREYPFRFKCGRQEHFELGLSLDEGEERGRVRQAHRRLRWC